MKIKTHDPFHISLKNYTTLTSRLILMGEFQLLKASFIIIEKFLQEGDTSIKEAIVEYYVPSLCRFLNECEWRNKVVPLLPLLLNEEYKRKLEEENSEGNNAVFILRFN